MVVKLKVSSLLSLHRCCDSSTSRPYPPTKPIATSVYNTTRLCLILWSCQALPVPVKKIDQRPPNVALRIRLSFPTLLHPMSFSRKIKSSLRRALGEIQLIFHVPLAPHSSSSCAYLPWPLLPPLQRPLSSLATTVTGSGDDHDIQPSTTSVTGSSDDHDRI